MRIETPGQGLLPRPDLVQRTEHQAGQKTEREVTPATQRPAQQPGKAQQAHQATQREHRQHGDIEAFHRAEHYRIQAQQHQYEAAGNTRQDHRADGDRARQKQAEHVAAPLHRRSHGNPERENDAGDESQQQRQVALLDLAPDQIDRHENQTEEKRPDRDRVSLQQVGDHLGEREDAGENAGEQNEQKGCIGARPGLGNTPAQQRTYRGGKRCDRAQQLVIDPRNERDRTARNARHNVGRAHGHALGVQQQSVFHASFR